MSKFQKIRNPTIAFATADCKRAIYS